MASAPMRDRPRLSVHVFRRFVEGRPEEERWELIDGVAVMMAPPTLAHQIIAGNLQRLLNDALEIRARPWPLASAPESILALWSSITTRNPMLL